MSTHDDVAATASPTDPDHPAEPAARPVWPRAAPQFAPPGGAVVAPYAPSIPVPGAPSFIGDGGGAPLRPTRAASKGLAVTALILGITAAALSWVPGAGALLGLVAVGFGIAALVVRQSKGLSIVGLSLGAFGFVASTVVALIAITVAMNSPEFASGELFGPDEPTIDTPVVEESPSADASSAPPQGLDLSSYAVLDEASFAALVADPGEHYGEQVALFGEVQQFDAYTGECSFLITVDETQQPTWEGYEEWAVAFAASSAEIDTTCDEFAGVSQFSHLHVWATVLGVSTVDFEEGPDDVLTLDIAYVEQLDVFDG